MPISAIRFWRLWVNPATIACQHAPLKMTVLARTLGLRNYFALAFGAMIGVGWLGAHGRLAGPRRAGRGYVGVRNRRLDFAPRGLRVMASGCSDRLTLPAKPPTPHRFSRRSSAISLAGPCYLRISSYARGKRLRSENSRHICFLLSIPSNSIVSPTSPCFCLRLVLGILMTLFLGGLNYRGIRGTAIFQGWATTAVLVLFAAVAVFSLSRGSVANLHPGFSAAPLVSILLVLQIVPYFMTGFESVPKAAEEANKEFQSQGFFRAIVLALLVGAAFLCGRDRHRFLRSPVAHSAGKRFATAVAFNKPRAISGRFV